MNKDNKDFILEAGYAITGAVAAAALIVQAVSAIGFIALKIVDKDR